MIGIRLEIIQPRNSIQNGRMHYLDHLKIFLTCLVIAHHSAQAYGPTGGAWVYINPGQKAQMLGGFIAVNASFFMGLFFMISGFFTPRSFQGKKPTQFIKNKLRHLMLPVLFILVAIVPVYFYIADTVNSTHRINFFDYYINTYWGKGLISYEHGWYLINLFMYSLVYTLIMVLLKNRKIKFLHQFKISYIFLLAILTGFLTFLIRLIYPIDRWIDFLGFIGMEPAHFPQYALFFIFGILAYNYHYIDNISKKQGLVIFASGLIMAIVIYFKDLNILQNLMNIIWNIWAFYESVMAVFLSIGLIIMFREYLNKINKLLKLASKSAFGAYIIHNLYVVSLQVLFDKVPLNAGMKFLCVCFLSIIASFATIILFDFIKKLLIKPKSVPNYF